MQQSIEEVHHSWILDASAILAMLRQEPGADFVKGILGDSIVSSVNWSEVIQRSLLLGFQPSELTHDFTTAGMIVSPFTTDQAEKAAILWSITRQAGLSLADRACLSLAQTLQLPAVTCDRAWAEVETEIEVRLIR